MAQKAVVLNTNRDESDADQRARILRWLEMAGGSAREALPRSRRGGSGGVLGVLRPDNAAEEA